MKYNIIGDIHGRTSWKDLVREDVINIFVGDYFSPYFPYPFKDIKKNFLEIIEYKKQHPETVLLIGNHDAEYWVFKESYSRHDFDNEKEIKQLLEDNKEYFQFAYSIENKALVTHAGVSYVWYERYKNHTLTNAAWNLNYDDPDEIKSVFPPYDMVPVDNPQKYLQAETPEIAFKMVMDKTYKFWDEANKKPKGGEFIEWKDKLWKYNKEQEKFEEYNVYPDEVAEFINSLWIEKKKYSAFSFDTNAGYGDYYGNDVKHGPMWIRPEALLDANIFEFKNIWQFFGHTQMIHKFNLSENGIKTLIIDKKNKIGYCDILGFTDMSVIYDSENEDIYLNIKNN